jgi:formylglycine-generating enzyme required for sulfatase activity/DNA-binding winged helix-turn-helix (wHTH) protein
MNKQPVYRFGCFVFNLDRGCLQEADADIELRPKSFQVLRQLVENAGRLMSKDELINAVWPNVVVSDDSLAHCIRDIRKALKDEDEQFIKTVPRRGYMFVAKVASPTSQTDLNEKNAKRAPLRAPDSDATEQDTTLAQASELAKFENDYRRRVIARYAEDASYFVPLSGITTEIAPDPTVSRRSARRRRRRAQYEYHEWLQSGEEIRQVKLSSLRDAVERYRCVILLGDPGCGKTSTLESLAHDYATENFWLPIPLDLGNFNAHDALEDFIVRGWVNLVDFGPIERSALGGILRHYLETGRLVFLFDALNEMPLGRYRDNCLALRQFIDRWSSAGNRFVVSCRVLDYGDELYGLQRIEIQPLSDEQIQQFIENECSQNPQALWRGLRGGGDNSDRLLEMARNPYMLTVMIDVFEQEGALIQNRSELMRRFVGILIGWATTKSSGPATNADVANAALSVMAFEMQRRSGFGTAAKTEDVKAVIPREVQVSAAWPPQPCDPDQIFSLATSANIIELPMDRKSVRFYHQLLQEFFAAQQMVRCDPSTLSSLWQWPWQEADMPLWNRPDNNFEPLPPPPSTGWEQTTILATGLSQTHKNELIAAVIRTNPVLAARCVGEGNAEIAPADRKLLVDELLSAIANPEVALRVRIAAGDALGWLGDPRIGEMAVIPVGEFTMGKGLECHQVSLPEYQIGRYPVTNAEFAWFVAAGGYENKSIWTKAGWEEVGIERKEPRFWNDPRFNKPNQPVIGLSWYECVAYCRWLSAHTGRLHRLPTEAEWEKAARGVDGRTYPWGNAFEASRLNAREGSQKAYCSTPVGTYPAGKSPFGLFDSAGNCWEWCATRWKKPYPYETGQDEWNEGYLEGQNLRALRGGSWNYEEEVTQCAYRFRFEPFGWNDRAGFRLVCPLPR